MSQRVTTCHNMSYVVVRESLKQAGCTSSSQWAADSTHRSQRPGSNTGNLMFFSTESSHLIAHCQHADSQAFVDVPHMFSKARETKAQRAVPANARNVTSAAHKQIHFAKQRSGIDWSESSDPTNLTQVEAQPPPARKRKWSPQTYKPEMWPWPMWPMWPLRKSSLEHFLLWNVRTTQCHQWESQTTSPAERTAMHCCRTCYEIVGKLHSCIPWVCHHSTSTPNCANDPLCVLKAIL